MNRNDQCQRCGKYLYGPAEANLRAKNEELLDALRHVIAEADRETEAFIRARKLLEKNK